MSYIFRLLVLVTLASISVAGSSYETELFVDSETGNKEYRLKLDGFHFGTLLADTEGRVIFRPHPDQDDVNGFGTSWFINPFLSGGDARMGSIDSVSASGTQVDILLTGAVEGAASASFGTWELKGEFQYDSAHERVTGFGLLTIKLNTMLSLAGADLNLERLSSNYLRNVPLQTGGMGDTGDMEKALLRYSSEAAPKEWLPPILPAHFPQELSYDLDIEVVGQNNIVDTLALGEPFQIQIARKPTLRLRFTSTDSQMIAGMVWDSSKGQDFSADNVGINHLITKESTTDMSFAFTYFFDSSVIQRVGRVRAAVQVILPLLLD